MATYIELVNRIVAELPRSETSITDIVSTHVQGAIRAYEDERFYFNEGRTSFTISHSSAYYNIPSDFLKLDVMTAVVGGIRMDIEPRTFQELEWYDDGVMTADPPPYVAIYAQQFRFSHIPTTTRQVDVFYQKKLSTLSATSDSNAWTTEAQDLIYARALKTLASVRYRDHDLANNAAALEMDTLERLRGKTEGMTGGGALRPDCI